jgi:hypothetical protein
MQTSQDEEPWPKKARFHHRTDILWLEKMVYAARSIALIHSNEFGHSDLARDLSWVGRRI